MAINAGGVLVRASGGVLADLPTPRADTAPTRLRTQQVLAELSLEQSWVLGAPHAAAVTAGLAEEVERLVALDNAVFWQALP